jgi:hypothetical protein
MAGTNDGDLTMEWTAAEIEAALDRLGFVTGTKQTGENLQPQWWDGPLLAKDLANELNRFLTEKPMRWSLYNPMTDEQHRDAGGTVVYFTDEEAARAKAFELGPDWLVREESRDEPMV